MPVARPQESRPLAHRQTLAYCKHTPATTPPDRVPKAHHLHSNSDLHPFTTSVLHFALYANDEPPPPGRSIRDDCALRGPSPCDRLLLSPASSPPVQPECLDHHPGYPPDIYRADLPAFLPPPLLLERASRACLDEPHREGALLTSRARRHYSPESMREPRPCSPAEVRPSLRALERSGKPALCADQASPSGGLISELFPIFASQ